MRATLVQISSFFIKTRVMSRSFIDSKTSLKLIYKFDCTTKVVLTDLVLLYVNTNDKDRSKYLRSDNKPRLKSKVKT